MLGSGCWFLVLYHERAVHLCDFEGVLARLDARNRLDLQKPAPNADDLPTMVEESALVLHFAGDEEHAGQETVDSEPRSRFGDACHGLASLSWAT